MNVLCKDKKIRVLLIKRTFEQFGGAERVLVSLISRLPDARFSIHTVILKNSSDEMSEMERQMVAAGCEYHVYQWHGKLSFVAIIRWLRQFCAENKIDLIHSHDPRSDLVSLILSHILRKPAVASLHGWVSPLWWMKAFEFIDYLSLFFFKGIIAVSNRQRDFLVRRGIPGSKIKTIYNVAVSGNGKDAAPFSPQWKGGQVRGLARTRWGIHDGEVVIGCVGRLSKEKGQHDLLHAFHAASYNRPNLRLLLAGDGSMKNDLVKQSEELLIRDRIIFAGFVNEVHFVYPAIDIYVCPSRKEWGLSLSVQEAIFHKIPVIATDIGGNPELIKDGDTGYLVPSGDIQHMSERIRFLVDNPCIAKRIADVANARYRANFNQDTFIEQTRDFYEELVS